MTKLELPYQLFDADNHMYETKDAFTRYLPDRYKNAIEYVEVSGRTKIALRGVISDYIPNPTFDVVARPGRRRSTSAMATRRASPTGRSSASRCAPSRRSASRRRAWS